jgi:predicted GNAT superfamily acetyltransferase
VTGRIVVRELGSADEFHETVSVSKEAWGFSDRVLSPWTDLIAGTHAGGMTAGSFEKGRMLGFGAQVLFWCLVFLALAVAIATGGHLTEFRYVGF